MSWPFWSYLMSTMNDRRRPACFHFSFWICAIFPLFTGFILQPTQVTIFSLTRYWVAIKVQYLPSCRQTPFLSFHFIYVFGRNATNKWGTSAPSDSKPFSSTFLILPKRKCWCNIDANTTLVALTGQFWALAYVHEF